MEQYVAILLLVVPGFIAMTISETFNRQKKKRDTFEITVSSLIYSVFVILFVYIFLLVFTEVSISDSNIKELFTSPRFVIKYATISILVSVYCGYMWNVIQPAYFFLINALRKMAGKNEIYNGTTFEVIFDDGNPHLIKINQKDIEQIGFIDVFNIEEGELIEISLVHQDKAKLLIDSHRVKEKRTLFSGEKTITEYDFTKNTDFKCKKRTKCIFVNLFLTSFFVALVYGFCLIF